MQRILIPTDFSANALHAAEYAVRLFGARGNTYVLLHAYMDVNAGQPMAPAYSMDLLKAAEDGLADHVDRFTRRTGAEGVEHVVMYGAVPNSVRAMVDEKGIDYVVMGKRGSSGSVLFGSNTTDVIKRCPVPVIAVPEQAPVRDADRILLADDHEDVRVSDLEPLARLARLRKAEVIVSNIGPIPVPGPHWSEGIYEVALAGVPHRFKEVQGEQAIQAIIGAAHDEGASMIAVLHRHLPLLEGIFHASAAKRLALSTDLPLLVLQHKD